MRRTLFAAGLALALAGATAAEAQPGCEAYAHNRKVTGTVIGALGGGLLGGAVAGHGVKTEGALLGAGLGAVAGNQLSRVHCHGYAARHTYYRHSARARSAPAAVNYPRYAATSAGACHYESRPYYDQTGRLMYAPMQVCD